MGIKPLPRKIRYIERDKTTKVVGTVEKESWVPDNHKFGHFRKLIQEIHFDGKDGTFIRLGYYWKKRGKPDSDYRWGSQTTFILSKEKFKELLKAAKKEGII